LLRRPYGTDARARGSTGDGANLRDSVEVGGRYSIYAGAVWNADGDSPVTCVLDL